MDFIKQFGGVMLLFIMLICAYGLFGSANVPQHATPDLEKVNATNTSEIYVYPGPSLIEQTQVDLGSIGVMFLLILATSFGELSRRLQVKHESEEEESFPEVL